MKLINIGIAGCLGKMGKELVKKTIEDTRVRFAGGFEHKDHKFINLIRIWSRSIRNKLPLLKTLLKSIFHLDASQWSKRIEHLTHTDVLFISHLLNKAQFNKRTLTRKTEPGIRTTEMESGKSG